MIKVGRKISRLSLVAIVLILVLVFYGLSLRKTSRLPWHQQIVVTIISPFQKGLNAIGGGASNIWNHYIALVGASKENESLKQKIDRQKLKLNRLAEVESENGRLRMLLGFKENAKIETIGADVVANDPRSDFRVLMINRGSHDGVAVDMPVIGAFGLIGRIFDVSGNSSRVLLITDPNNAVDVIDQRSRARALLVGATTKTKLTPAFYLSRLEYLSRKSDMLNGDTLVTSGLDGIYPPGIPVGVVKDLEHKKTGVFRGASVVPFVDLGNLEEVLIVVR